MLRQIHSQVGLVEFDNAGQVISIDVNDEEIDSASSWGNIAPIAKSKTKTSFKPTLTALGEKMRGFISASMIAMKAKSFDDGLYAAIDLMAHEGVSTFAGKRELIQLVLARALANDPLDRSDGLQVLACAALSSGSAISLPNDLRSIIEEHLAQFETSFLSKPLGFYSWTQELSQLFKHDRLLQTKCLDNNFLSLISVLKTDENLKQRYLAYLNLISRLTNPLTNCGLATAVSSPEWAPTDEKVAFFPASNSHELELYKKIQAEVESGKTSLIEELLKGVKSGEIQLTPTSESGWYDWQLYALEPLAIVDKMPEAKHLVPSEKYRDRLEELFKGLYALSRETHVKQLEMSFGSAGPPFYIYPELRIEPLPSYYLRRSWSYTFIRGILENIFGAVELQRVKRETPDIEPMFNLWDELCYMENLFLGAHAISCDDLGMQPFSQSIGIDDAQLELARKTFLDWKTAIETDKDIARDGRMMVPVATNEDGQVLVWTLLGWDTVKLEVTLKTTPNSVRVTAQSGKQTETEPGYKFDLRPASYYAAYPVMTELWISPDKVMTRPDFCAFCDRFTSDKEIIANLTSVDAPQKA